MEFLRLQTIRVFKFLCVFSFVVFITIGARIRVQAQVEEKTVVYDLRCNNISEPAGIGETYPSFSWKLSSNQRDILQIAYQVTVASSLEKLNTNPDMWNSGKVASGENTFVHYAGKPLNSAARYYWKVSVWINKDKQVNHSKSTYFITGLLTESAWDNAQWIAYDTLPDNMKVFPGVHGRGNKLGDKAKKRSVIPYFRKDFSLHKQIEQAYIYVSGLGQYVLSLNGKRVDSSFLNPAWSDYTKRCYYNSYDVTTYLKQGTNVIGAIVGNGFLYINRERYRKLTVAGGYPMLRLKMVIRYTDGSVKEITTDGSWKTAPSAITFSSIYGGENFNANKVKEGWNTAGFSDKSWKQAMTISGLGGEMQPQESYSVVIDQIFAPVSIDSSKIKIQLYDFGQNMSGIIRLKARGPRGYRIRITPSELVDGNYLPDQKASGYPYYWEYTLSGEETECWQPLFSYYGFRYAAIEVYDPEGRPASVNIVNIDSLLALHTQNGAQRTGSFSCSDTLFNQIFTLIHWGIRNNLSHVATDCPHREKLGWLEETHLMGNSIQYNYDILNFYEKIIQDMMDAQLPNGLVPDIAPEYVIFDGGFRDSPEWGSACVLVPWYVYRWYGDKDILQKCYPMMKKYVSYLGSKATGHLLAYGLGDWYDLGPEPPGVSQLTPLGLTATAFYYYDVSILSRVAALLGDSVGHIAYKALAKKIKKSFNQRYFDEETNVYATGSQTAYAIPLYTGIVDSAKYSRVFANLVDSIVAHHYTLTAGDIGFRYVVQVLKHNNASDVIYKMNNRMDVPGYGYQIKKGATALTESWQALRNVSNDHMMLGHLMEWFYSGLGGIGQQRGDAGYKKVLIKPQFLHEIEWVDCSYYAVNGPIAVKWQRENNNRIKLQVQIPSNTTARVCLPVQQLDQIRENGEIMNSRRINGVHRFISKDDMTLIEVGSGKYIFSFPSPDISIRKK